MVSARRNTALQSLKPIKYSLEHRNFTLPKFMMKNPRAVWSSRAHPPFSLNRAKPNLLNKHQVEPATARNPTRPTRVDRPGPQSQQAHSAELSRQQRLTTTSPNPTVSNAIRFGQSPASPELGREGRAAPWREPSLSASRRVSPRCHRGGGRAVEEPAAVQAAERW